MAIFIFRRKKRRIPDYSVELSHLSSQQIPLFHGDAGFSYIGVMLLTAIMGIAIASANHMWSTTIKREMEAELLFRGIRSAVRSSPMIWRLWIRHHRRILYHSMIC